MPDTILPSSRSFHSVYTAQFSHFAARSIAAAVRGNARKALLSQLFVPCRFMLRSIGTFFIMTSMSPKGRDFTPAAWLRNPHFMTVFPGYWPRRALLAGVPTESRLFTTEPHTQLLGFCHWQPHRTA